MCARLGASEWALLSMGYGYIGLGILNFFLILIPLYLLFIYLSSFHPFLGRVRPTQARVGQRYCRGVGVGMVGDRGKLLPPPISPAPLRYPPHPSPPANSMPTTRDILPGQV